MGFKIYKPREKTLIGYLGAFILLVYFTMVFIGSITVSDWKQLHVPMVLTVVICTYIIAVDKRTLPLGANTMVYFYTVLSLLGLMILLPWFPEITSIRSEMTMSFLYYKELIIAIALSCIGILTFVLSTSLFSHQVKGGMEIKSPFGQGLKDLDESNYIKYRGITYLGLFLTLYCTLFFIFFVLKNPGMLASGYTERMASTNNSSIYSHTTVLMALSIVMVLTTGTRRDIKIGLFLFAITAVINFVIGNRGEVYYPILACIAIYTRRNGTFKPKTLLIGVIGSLIIIPIVRTARTIGVFSGGIGELLKTISPVQAVAEAIGEMGFQIGPFTYLLRYLNDGGSLQYGDTIFYSFQNFLYKYIPFMSPPDPMSPAAIKTIMPTSYYAFSNLAEGYYNFGIIGMVLLSILLAWFLVNSNKFIRGVYSLLFSNMILVEIILWVRNSSGTMPVYLAWTIVLLIMSWVVQVIYNSRFRRSYGKIN